MLKLEQIQKTFYKGSVNEKKALQDINLEVSDGDFITIIGSNGAGKSTLFNVIGGNLLADSGKIELDHKNISFQPEYKRAKYIGRLFQDPLRGTAPNMTIQENLALAYLRAETSANPFSRITKKDERFFQDIVSTLQLGLEDRMHVQVGSLSGGQRQALSLLMATIVPPKLLLLDEHTAALDPAAANKIMELTNKIVKDHHITCLMVTHNLKMALETGNRMLMMNQGKIVCDMNQEEKANLSVEELMVRFQESLNDDRILLTED